jgi:O-antigen ligase
MSVLLGAQRASRRHAPAFGTAALGVAALAAGTAAGVAALDGHLGVLLAVLAATAGLPAAAWLTWLAFTRFEMFLLALFAVRPMLDAFKPNASGSSFLSLSTGLGLLFLVAAAWWLHRQWRRGHWVRSSWMSLAFLTMPLAEFLTIPISVSPATSLVAALRLLTGALMFTVLEQAYGSGALSHRRLMRWTMTSLVTVCLYGVMQKVTGFGLEFDTDMMATRLQGPFVHPSVLAKYLVILMLWMVAAWSASRDQTRAALALGVATTSVLLGLTMTRIAWVAALLGALLIVGQRNRRVIPLALATCALAVAAIAPLRARITSLFTQDSPAPGIPANSMQWRWDYWQQLIPHARMSPFNGIGAGTTSLVGSDGLQAHNTWVQVYLETGLFGVVALLTSVAGFWLTLRTAKRAARGLTPANRDWAVVHAAVAVGVVLFLFLQTENLLDETSTLWYGAAVLCAVCKVAVRPGHSGADSPANLHPIPGRSATQGDG